MKDIVILFSIISLFIGVASISISVFINQNYNKRSLELFIGLNISFFFIQSSIFLNTYVARMKDVESFIIILSRIFDITGTSLSSFFGLFLINSLLGKEISNTKKIIILFVSAFQLIAITIYYLSNAIYLGYTVRASIILVIVYELLITILSYKQIGNKDFKKAVNVFTIITLIFLPFFIFESFRVYIPVLEDVILLKILSLPSYFLVINICSLGFANRYFNSPAFIEDDKLTEFFIKKYSITEKEIEVIEMLLAGLTYKQIAENLYIANKTVDNHIQNIYKKLEVTSKIQLFNLVRSKEK
ncbi:MAG: helix-turn-helix transcriptional regulator [Clostridium sp.]|uniref:helix-turn-helix transcriptional regulator n=1 Tax=Clostridium sp. TaxID=1506 RepID=UPI0039EB7C2A